MSEKKSVATSQQKGKAAKTPTMIYLGPAIAGAALPGTVYNNGLTQQMEAAVKEEPSLKKLLVEVKQAGQVRKEIRNAQSAAGICYQKALDYAKKKGAKG